MASKTATCVAGGLKFQDPFGIEHVVTTSQTFTFTLTDGGASAVTYQQDHGTSVTTTDGRRLTFRPSSPQSTVGASGAGTIRTWGPTADAQDAVAVYSLAGEFGTDFSEGGIRQHWKARTLTVDNVDAPGQMDGVWEDQFGRTMTWTGITVA